MNEHAEWVTKAERLLLAEREQAPRTPLRELPLPALRGKRLVFKDESAHATGSLKHRLARSLFLHALRQGRLRAGMPVFDASSGSTAVSEASFAHMLGLEYFAVIPAGTSLAKQELIHQFGGQCVLVEGGACCKREAARLAAEKGGCFLDQFANAAEATDWRSHNVITELFEQLHEQGVGEPDWFVMGAGTGGTSTCAGRFFRNTGRRARLMVVDPEDSAFFGHYACSTHASGCICASRIEGIGRPTVEPSFSPELVDRMHRVPDAASYAAARWLTQRLGQPVGLSTGTNLFGAIALLGEPDVGLVTTLICDDGRRYTGRLDSDAWLAQQGLDIEPWIAALDRWYMSGEWRAPVTHSSPTIETISRTVA